MSAFKLNTSMFIKPLNLPPSAWIGHIPFAAWIVEELQPAIFVELGTHTGTSYLAFCQAVQENGLPTKCFAVDTWEGDKHAGDYEEDIYEVLQATHDDRYAGFSRLMRMTFDEANALFVDGSIDLLHIDGLHTFEAVRHDFETWLPKMSDRGVILFHDTMVRERDFGVWKQWSEIRELYPFFEFYHSHGLGVLLVGKSVPETVSALSRMTTDEQTLALRLFERAGASVETITQNGPGLQTYLSKQLKAAQVQIAEANLQLGKADAFAKAQTAEVEHLMQEIADREEQIKLLNGQVADRGKELVKASEHLLAADQNARAHVAESKLVARDIQDLQRELVARQELIGRLHAQLQTCQEELASARSRPGASDQSSPAHSVELTPQDDAPR